MRSGAIRSGADAAAHTATMIFELAQDFHDALAALPQKHPRQRIVQLFEAAIRRRGTWIDHHPSTLFQCMWNLCWWHDCPEAARHYGEPRGGWTQPPPWRRPGPKLFRILETWRGAKEQQIPRFAWLRELRPPSRPVDTSLQAVFRGQMGGVRGLAFRPDGRRIVSGGGAGVVVWDAWTGKLLARCHHGGGWITCVACSPDGRRGVSGNSDGTGCIWDIDSGEELARLSGQRGIAAVAYSPDGTRVATAGGEHDNDIRVWDTQTGKELAAWGILGARGYTGVAFSPDGRCIANGGGYLRVSDAKTGEELAAMRGHGSAGVWSVAFSPDGRRIASAGGYRDNTVRVWDAATGEELAVLHGHSAGVSCVTYAPDNRHIASASQDKTVRIWDAETGTELAVLRGHHDRVKSIVFSPSGRHIASGGDRPDNTVCLWNAQLEDKPVRLREHTERINCIACTPDGGRILSGGHGDTTIRVWDGESGVSLAVLPGHKGDKGSVEVIACSPDGRRIVSGGNDNTARIWDAGTGRQIAVLKGHRDSVKSVAFAPDGCRVATGGSGTDGCVRVWDTASGRSLAVFRTDAVINAVTFSPDGRRVLGAGHRAYHHGSLTMWDIESGENLALFDEYGDPVNCVAFSPDGRWIVSGGVDLRVWDADNGDECAVLSGHQGRDGALPFPGRDAVVSVACSPDSSRLVSLGGWEDGTIRVWEVGTWRCLEIIQGRGDIHAIAVGTGSYSFRAIEYGLGTEIQCASTGECLAWFPELLFGIKTLPGGRRWVGHGDVPSHLTVIQLEGVRPEAGAPDMG